MSLKQIFVLNLFLFPNYFYLFDRLFVELPGAQNCQIQLLWQKPFTNILLALWNHIRKYFAFRSDIWEWIGCINPAIKLKEFDFVTVIKNHWQHFGRWYLNSDCIDFGKFSQKFTIFFDTLLRFHSLFIKGYAFIVQHYKIKTLTTVL